MATNNQRMQRTFIHSVSRQNLPLPKIYRGRRRMILRMLGAIKTIIVADAVMSLDNIVAIAGASNGNLELVILGIVISIPIITWGSKLVLHLWTNFR